MAFENEDICVGADQYATQWVFHYVTEENLPGNVHSVDVLKMRNGIIFEVWIYAKG